MATKACPRLVTRSRILNAELALIPEARLENSRASVLELVVLGRLLVRVVRMGIVERSIVNGNHVTLGNRRPGVRVRIVWKSILLRLRLRLRSLSS